MTFQRGHQSLGVFVDFPHNCPGEGCAVEHWILTRATKTAWLIRHDDPHPPKDAPIAKPLIVERSTPVHQKFDGGKTWPELVADLVES